MEGQPVLRRHGKEPLVFELDRPVAFAHPGLQPGAVGDRDVPPPIVDQPGRLEFSGGLGNALPTHPQQVGNHFLGDIQLIARNQVEAEEQPAA